MKKKVYVKIEVTKEYEIILLVDDCGKIIGQTVTRRVK